MIDGGTLYEGDETISFRKKILIEMEVSENLNQRKNPAGNSSTPYVSGMLYFFHSP